MSLRAPRRLALLFALSVVAAVVAIPSSASAASLPKLGSLPTFNGVPQLVSLAQSKGIPVTASPACSALSPLGPIPVAVVHTILPIDVALSLTYTGNVSVSLGTPKDPRVCVLRFDLTKFGFSGAGGGGKDLVEKLLGQLKLPQLDPATATAQIKAYLEQAKSQVPASVVTQINTVLDKLKSLKPAQLQDLLSQLNGLAPKKLQDLLTQVQKLWGSKSGSFFSGLLEQLHITLPSNK